MSAVFFFLMVVAEIIAVLAGLYMPQPELYDILVHHSPGALVFAILDEKTSITHPLLPLIILFHALKYLFMMRANFSEDRRSLFYLGIILETGYLAYGVLHLA